MLFTYRALDASGSTREGRIDALNKDTAISSLQRRGFVVLSVSSAEEKSLFGGDSAIFNPISYRDVVILSRQIATLFEAQVSALRVFRLLAEETENKALAKVLHAVADDIQAGSSISNALEKHQNVFTPFYVNMVRSGEESGKLDQTFTFLADYLDRLYELIGKVRGALVYPAFVVATFVVVLILMLTLVIPRLSEILLEAGQEVPFYTRIVIGASDFFRGYGVFLLLALMAGLFWAWRAYRTKSGRYSIDELKLGIPYLGSLYRKFYLARIADNMSTMLLSGIPMVRTLEVTASVVDNAVYEEALLNSVEDIKGGSSIADAFAKYPAIPRIMSAMIKVGEETGELGTILSTLSKFYRREVNTAVDSLVGLIEPAMIVTLGVAVSVLLAGVLIPIYNISSAI